MPAKRSSKAQPEPASEPQEAATGDTLIDTETQSVALAASSGDGPALPDLVLTRLRELISEASGGTQLEALVRVAERLPQWHSALGEQADSELSIEGLTLKEAVSEVRRIADLAESAMPEALK
jgi:hypothetical protein